MKDLGGNDAQYLSRREFIRTCSSTLFVAIASGGVLSLAGCGGGGGSSGGQGPLATSTVAGTVDTSEIGGSGLAALTSLGSTPVDASGRFSVPISSTLTQVVAVSDTQGTLRGSAVVSASTSSGTINAASSAAALVFLTPGILTLDPQETILRLSQIQGLQSFTPLADYVRQQAPSVGMNILATTPTGINLTTACANEWMATYKPHIRKAHDVGRSAGDVTITINSSYTQSGQQLLASNIGWRFIDLFRFDLDATGTILSPSPTKITMAGAIPAGWGSLLDVFGGNGVGSPTEATDTIPFDPTSNLATLEYWIYGIGFGSVPQNPTTSSPPVPDLACWGYTWIYYTFLPLLDTAIGMDHHGDVDLAVAIWSVAEPYLTTFLQALATKSTVSVLDIAHTFSDMYGAVVSNKVLLKDILTTVLKTTPSMVLLFLLEHLGTAMSATNFLFNAYTLMAEPELAAVDLSFTSTVGVTIQ